MKPIILNKKAEAAAVVSADSTAKSVGSGSLDVFGTPMMIALMERATCLAASEVLDEGETTVGTRVNVSHLSPTVTGREVRAEAELVGADGRALCFRVQAFDGAGLIGEGEITRFVVLSQKFMKKAEDR